MKRYITQLDEKGNVAVDDTILVKDAEATAGSHILKGFKPLFSAEAVERLQNAGYVISGKTNVGEFGLDMLGEFSYYGAVKGSDGKALAGAAAALIAEGGLKAALNVDLNGAPRRAAAVSGIDFIKPTYGAVSRYGIIPCACSGEQIGVSAANAQDAAELLSVIAGHDGKDGTSLPAERSAFSAEQSIGGLRVCAVKELFEHCDDGIKDGVNGFIKGLKSTGLTVDEISLDFIEAAQSAWQIMLAAETCNNVSRYDGVKFGYRTPNYGNIDELYINTRTEGLNFLTKATVLYGSDVLSKNRYDSCYDKALRIRRVTAENMKHIFEEYDVVLTPARGKAVYYEYDIKEAFMKVFEESAFTAIPNLTGIPCMITKGVQLMAPAFGESVLLSVAKRMEGM